MPEYLLPHGEKVVTAYLSCVSRSIAAAHGEKVVTAYLSCHLELLLHMKKVLTAELSIYVTCLLE